MLRQEFLLLTLGKGPIFKDPYFWEYVKSTKRVQNADCVVLSDDITEDDEARLEDKGIMFLGVSRSNIYSVTVIWPIGTI
jgi:hypothetical protein